MNKNITAIVAVLIGCIVIALAIRAGSKHTQCRECKLATATHAK